MKIAIMQPYFLPYIGYFQLMNAVDTFVVYDNIEFTKKGWINRNRMLVNGKDDYFTLSLKKDSDFLAVNQRFLADSFLKDNAKTLRKIKELYAKAPEFGTVYPLLEEIFRSEKSNLFDFILNGLQIINGYLNIKTKIVISSAIAIDHKLKSQEKVIAICREMHADTYINAIGGMELYSKEAFQEQGIQLHFIKSDPLAYKQFDADFVPWLSIVDVLFFNTKEKVQDYLNQYIIL